MFSPLCLFEIFMKMFYVLMMMQLVYILVLSKLAKPRQSYTVKTLFTFCLLITIFKENKHTQCCVSISFITVYYELALFSYSTIIKQKFLWCLICSVTLCKHCILCYQKNHLWNKYSMCYMYLYFQGTELDGKCGCFLFIC